MDSIASMLTKTWNAILVILLIALPPFIQGSKIMSTSKLYFLKRSLIRLGKPFDLVPLLFQFIQFIKILKKEKKKKSKYKLTNYPNEHKFLLID